MSTDRPVGVILYGPPASGKDTVTSELEQLDSSYELFRKLKASDGPLDEGKYRAATVPEFLELVASGGIVYENARYGARYAVDRESLAGTMSRGRIPVVHMGQVAGVTALVDGIYDANWVSVLLLCGREATAVRSAHRGDLDQAERLRLWDETDADLRRAAFQFDLVINTEQIRPDESALRVHAMAVGKAYE